MSSDICEPDWADPTSVSTAPKDGGYRLTEFLHGIWVTYDLHRTMLMNLVDTDNELHEQLRMGCLSECQEGGRVFYTHRRRRKHGPGDRVISLRFASLNELATTGVWKECQPPDRGVWPKVRLKA